LTSLSRGVHSVMTTRNAMLMSERITKTAQMTVCRHPIRAAGINDINRRKTLTQRRIDRNGCVVLNRVSDTMKNGAI